MTSQTTATGCETVTLSLPDKPEFISLARMSASMIANLAGLSFDEIEDIKVALSEACTNALRYGCTKSDHYEVAFSLSPKLFEISVRDNGDGYDFESVQQPLLGGEQIGGFGLFIIRSLMDNTEITSAPQTGTTITMQKNLRVEHGNQKPAD